MTLLLATTAMLAVVCPAAPATLADAIATAAEETADAERTAALLVVTAMAESSCRADAIGDHGRSAGFFGLWCGSERRCAAVIADPYGAARMARDLLAESLTVCRAQRPAERLGLYLGGACDRGLAQSRHRWWWLRRLTARGTT